jgi:ATP-dependent helicase/nuclease subunit B
MAVQFILGRSGTGKSNYCIRAIVKALGEQGAEVPLIFLVPEQATYQAERSILSDERLSGYSRLNVVSFDRLLYLLSGRNAVRPSLSKLGQQMIIHRILREKRQELKVFGASANEAGLSREMSETINELYDYAKTADDIEVLLANLRKDEEHNLAAMKFADIAVIFRAYSKTIENNFINPETLVREAILGLAKSEFVKGAKLWVDGFSGFTASETAILREMLKVVSEAKIALCLDADSIELKNPGSAVGDSAGLFYPTERTYAELLEMVQKLKLAVAEPVILEQPLRFSDCETLGHIERNLFGLRPGKINKGDNVRIVKAANARDESVFIARQIIELVKKKGYRYRDIAVITSDIDCYQYYIRAAFADYGIPFFIDKRKPLSHHPVIGFIRSVLGVVVDDFSHGDIFACLKSPLFGIDDFEADLLENYCLACGIRSGDWMGKEQWHFADTQKQNFDEERINQIRAKASRPLLELRDRLLGSDVTDRKITSFEFVRVVYNFLCELGVFEKLNEWIQEAQETGDAETANEHRQFYESFINICDELTEVFGEIEMECGDFASIFESVFSQFTLAFIPPSMDQVLVGSIERSRHPNLKAVFLAGLTQKQFPSPIRYSGILNDADRKAAQGVQFELAGTMERTLAERQYLAYIAFTRASEYLCVSYPAADSKGKATVASEFIENLQSLFDDAEEESTVRQGLGIEEVHSETELADILCRGLGRDADQAEPETKDKLAGLLEEIRFDEELRGMADRVTCATEYDNQTQLDNEVVSELFGERINSSATRLTTFAACAYQHFARYILELKERDEFRFEPLDLGIFYHTVLDSLLKRLKGQQKDIAVMEQRELLKILREQIAKVVNEDSFFSNFVRHGPHNSFIIRSAGERLEDCVSAIQEMVLAGLFRPAVSEITFGDKGQGLGEYKIALSGGRILNVRGKIDRLDITEIDGERVGIVFDYKRRGQSFSWPRFFNGLDMQLPIYMLAVRDGEESTLAKTVGGFYMPIEVKSGDLKFGELQKQIKRFEHKAKGLFDGGFFDRLDSQAGTGDNKFYNFYVTRDGEPYGNYGTRGALRFGDFEKVLGFAEAKISELAERTVSGEIEVKPYRLGANIPCGYCKYKPLCRFDWQINDYNLLQSLSKSDFLEETGDDDE